MSNDNEIKPYEKLFKKLIITSKRHFNDVSINIVQQQDPKCLISKLEDDSIYIRVSKKDIQGIDKYCAGLASIKNLAIKILI